MSRGRTPASERARRLVALIGHFRSDEHYRVAELAELVGTSERELTADLMRLSVCGVAPYYPDDYIPVFVEDGMVEVLGELPALSGPVRLSPAEARALALALEYAGFAPDADLTTRLLDAAGTVAFDAQELERTLRAATSEHDNGVFATLAESLEHHLVVTIDYQGAQDGSALSRDVEPLTLFAERGVWYLTAWCRRAGAWRTFRVDRIQAASPTAEKADAAAHESAPTGAVPGGGHPLATLRFAPPATFEEREWPGGRVSATAADGTTTVEVPFAGTAWLARRVVARQGDVEVLAPAEMRRAVADLARELLDSSR